MRIGALQRVFIRDGAREDALFVIAEHILERLQRPLDIGVRLVVALALKARRNASCRDYVIRLIRAGTDGPRIAALTTRRNAVHRR